ncbi:MAG: hypothetical protein ABIT09_10845 [Croceibacterium sp.]
MDDIEVAAELTKINFLMENLYALALRANYGSQSTIDEMVGKSMSEFALPVTMHGSGSVENLAAMQKLAAQRLAMFFARVKDRMNSAEI